MVERLCVLSEAMEEIELGTLERMSSGSLGRGLLSRKVGRWRC